MKSLLKSFIVASLCLLAASAGYAQNDGKQVAVKQEPVAPAPDEWQVTFTPYAWLPSVDADFSIPTVTVGNRTIGGDFSIHQPWWETVSKFSSNYYVLCLDARLEAWKGRWGGFLDGYWIFGKSRVDNSDSRLVVRDRVDITASSSVTSRFDAGQFNFGPQFKLGTAPLGTNSSVAFVVYGGGRVNWLGDDVDGTLKIKASANIGEIGRTINFSSNNSRAFVEPMIGLKASWSFGDNVKAIIRGDVGGFGFVKANNWDCDLETGIAWRIMRNAYLDLGYRARGQWQDVGSNGGTTISGWFYGPELGMTFSF